MENVAAQWVGEDRRARKGEEGDQFVAGQGALLASLERMELGICVVDEDLNFTGFNSRFFDLLDMPHDLFGIGDSYEDFVRHIRARGHCCPSETEFLVKERARSFVPTIFDHEVTERTLPDGMTLEIQYNPMPEGGFFCLYSDITQRKEKERLVSQSEQRARAAERRLADAIESVEEAFALYDSEDRLVTCSSIYRELFPSVADDRVPGAFFEDHLRKDILQHHLFEIEGDEEAYLKRHLALHRNPRKPFEHQLRNGRWILVNERRTSDGGTVSLLTDVTAIKIREHVLQMSEERFLKVLHASPTITSVTSLRDGQLLDVNDTWCRSMGFQREEVIGRRVYEVDTWVDVTEREKAIQDIRNGLPVRHRETRFRTRRGETREFIFSIEISELDGEECLLFFAHDISAQKQAQRALAQSEQRFRDFAESASDWLWEMDENFRFTFASENYAAAVGIEPDLIFGRTRWEINGVDDPHVDEFWRKHHADLAEHKPFRDLRYCLQMRGSDPCYVRVHGKPVFDDEGNFRGYRGVGINETRRLTAERQRREMEARLRTVLDTMPLILWAVDKEGVFTLREGKALETTAYRPELRAGSTIFDLYGDRPDIMAHMKRVLDGEEFVAAYNAGRGRFETLFTPLRSETGKVIGAMGVSADVTERDQVQAQLIQSAKMATLGEMATSVAHELNQPLNIIRLAAESTLERLDDGERDIENFRFKLARISRQTARAADIIDHMKFIGRKSADAPRRIDLRISINGALSIMRERLRLESIELSVEIPEDCSQVLDHSVQLEQVILNLLSNSFDVLRHRESTSGLKRVALDIVDRRADDEIDIVVTDTGGGIEDVVAGRIFEPFVTTKEVGKGTGLGLSISYGIITEMGGTIKAENTEDGAQFTITLPIAEHALLTA